MTDRAHYRATAGFGQAAARKFAGEGWRVIGTGRRGDRLRELGDELGDRFLGLEIDMRDREAIEGLARLEGEWGAIDLLINNAGLAPSMGGVTESEWDKIQTALDTNITGLVALTRALLPRLIERKGAIINLSSVAATYPYKGGAVYAGSKAFVRQFSLDLRCDLAGTGVRVTSIDQDGGNRVYHRPDGGDKAASDALYAGMDPMTSEDLADLFWWSRPCRSTSTSTPSS